MHLLANLKVGVVALAAVALSGAAQAGDITGAGSTFVYPILSKWSADYSVKTGNKVNYQSIGSGGGIAQIKGATVDFGASDMPLMARLLTIALLLFATPAMAEECFLVIAPVAPGSTVGIMQFAWLPSR